MKYVDRITNGADPYSGWTRGGDVFDAGTNVKVGSLGVGLRFQNSFYYPYIEQSVDLTGVSQISFQVMQYTAGKTPSIALKINGTTIQTVTQGISDIFTTYTIDIPETAGTATIHLEHKAYINSYIRNVSALALVEDAPVAAFSATPISGAVPLTVQFTDNTLNNPTSWLWTFGDGEISTEQNPVHVYHSVGLFQVSLTVTNTGGSNTLNIPDYISVIKNDPLTIALNIIPHDCPVIIQYERDGLRIRAIRRSV